MRKITIFTTLALATMALLLISPTTTALPINPNSMNARFVKWDKHSHVIHIFIFWDEGRPGYDPAEVDIGQPVLFGFEWAGGTVEELREFYNDNPDHFIEVSVDGGSWLDVKGGYQEPFVAGTRSGPAWSWDHDGDGPGDRNGNGIGDWSGPVLFFRWQSAGLSAGEHNFDFRFTNDGGSNWYNEVITVIAG